MRKQKNKNDQLRKKIRRTTKNLTDANKTSFEQQFYHKEANEMANSKMETYKVHNLCREMTVQLESTNLLLSDVSKTVENLVRENREIKNALNHEIISHKETKNLQSNWISNFDTSLGSLKNNMNDLMIK